MPKYLVDVSWSVTVSGTIEVESETPEQAIAKAEDLVVNDEDTAEELATQAHESVRDAGAWSVAPAEANGHVAYGVVDE